MKIGRNDDCPCDSGKKYKKCCLSKEVSHARVAPVKVASCKECFIRPREIGSRCRKCAEARKDLATEK